MVWNEKNEIVSGESGEEKKGREKEEEEMGKESNIYTAISRSRRVAGREGVQNEPAKEAGTYASVD